MGNTTFGGGRLTFAGWADKPLTPRGEAQAQCIASRLANEKLDAVYASDLQRARDTAKEIADRHSLEVRVERDLREINYGGWEGLGYEEILRDWKEVWDARQLDPERVAPPQGESYVDLWRRLKPAWERVVNNHEAGGHITVVAHNGTVRILLCHLLGVPVANYKRLHVSNCGLTHIEIKRKLGQAYAFDASNGSEEVLVRFINDVNHLRELETVPPPIGGT